MKKKEWEEEADQVELTQDQIEVLEELAERGELTEADVDDWAELHDEDNFLLFDGETE